MQLTSTETFNANVLTSPTPVIVKFEAPWCGPCKMMAPELEKAAVQIGARVDFFAVNSDENPSLCTEFGVAGVPALVLFKGGQAVDRLNGYQNAKQIAGFIERNL